MQARDQAELILLIEDDAGITELVKEKLSEYGRQVVHVSTGKAAREWLEHNQPMLILLDYSLPGQSGLEFLEQIEATPGGMPPFIVTTGAGDEKIAVAMMKQGARDYLVKDRGFLETLPLVVERVLKQLATEQKLAESERALRESEIFKQAIISNSPIGISVRSQTGQLLSANAAWKKIWAIPDADVQEDLSRKRDKLELDRRDDYLFPHHGDVHRIYEKGGSLHLPELKVKHPRPGAAEWVSQHFYAILNEQGQVDRVVILTEDITERKRAENALRESEERYHIIFEQAGDYTLLLEVEDGQIPVIVEANESALRAHGYSREELIGKSISLIDPNTSLATVSELVEEIQKSGSFIFNTRHRRKDGTWLDVEVNSRLVRIGDKEFYLSVERDITERKQAEEKLRATTAQLETLIQVSPLAIIALDTDGNVQLWNASAERIFGWSAGEIIGNPNPIVPVEKQEEYTHLSRHILSGEPLSSQETIRLRKDGTLVPVSVSSAMMYDDRGNIAGRMAIIADITEHKQAEEAIRASEEKYRLLFSNNPAPMWVYDNETLAFLAVNEFAIDHYGYSREEFLGMTIRDIRPPEEIPFLYRVLNTDIGPLRKVGAVKHRKKDGSIIYVDISGHEIEFEGRPAMLVLALDITERVQAEEALRENENRLRTIFETSQAGIILVDPRGVITFANQSMADMFGCALGELIGSTYPEHIHPDQRHMGGLKMRQLIDREIDSVALERHYIRKDGSDFWGFLSGRRHEDEKGNLLSLVGIIADISQLKQAEKKLRAVLHDKEVLLRELYHRTKNNMQVISSILNLELAEIEDETVMQALLDMDSRIRSMALVHQKLYQSQNLSSLDLKEYIADLVNLLLESYQVIPERINFKMKAESVPVLIDTAIPCGLIINEILSNTLKHAFPGNRKGNIHIRLARTKDATIILEISDDGIGVPAEKDLRQSNTLGMQTIFGIASHQLGAKVDLKTDRGVAWRIQFADNQYTSRV